MNHRIVRALRSVFGVLKNLPPVRRVYSILVPDAMSDWQIGAGLFQSFPAALNAVPPERKVGFDQPAMVNFCAGLTTRVFTSDYAIAFWLRSLLAQSSTLFELGGNTGITYYALERLLQYPASLRWLICDLPLILQRGRELAAQRQARHLAFTASYADADGCDLLLTAGTLQYLATDLAAILAPLQRKPRHLLINRVPLSDGDPYVTLQDLGPVICVYRVFARRPFIASLLQLGYRLVDQWECPENACRVRYHPATMVTPYSGLYLELNA